MAVDEFIRPKNSKNRLISRFDNLQNQFKPAAYHQIFFQNFTLKKKL